MASQTRHQCMIYKGSPSVHLASLAAVAREKLSENFRCLYLNSPPMVAGMRSYVAAAGIDVAREVERGSLVLSSALHHLRDGAFDVARMLQLLDDAVIKAIEDGYKGLWATGDMTWQFGPAKDFTKLLEYETKLEDYFHRQPALCGICQYHEDSLPAEATRAGLQTHPSVFINETLSRLNAQYLLHRA